jgi:hypothetical protein
MFGVYVLTGSLRCARQLRRVCLAGYAGRVVGAVSCAPALAECGVFLCDGGYAQ